jgi:hypothetical protein
VKHLAQRVTPVTVQLIQQVFRHGKMSVHKNDPSKNGKEWDRISVFTALLNFLFERLLFLCGAFPLCV